jgi:hypothetical protein
MTDKAVQEVEELLKQEGIENESKEETPVQESVEEKQESEERVLTDFEEEQKSKGWNPDGPKSAEEWARAEPLYQEIKARGKENKQMRRTINELKDHMQKLEQHAYERAVRDLEREQKEALSIGDEETANRIQAEKENMVKPEPVHDAVLEFQDTHSAWLQDKSFESLEMQRWVMQRDNDLMSYNLPPEEHMALLDEHVRKKFPSYFGAGQEQEETPTVKAAVESGHSNNVVGPAKGKKKKFSLADLNPEQKQTARDFEKMGVMPIDEYIKQLVASGDLD